MWHLKLKNGVTISEALISSWDSLPPETEIVSASLVVPRTAAAPYVIELVGFDRYCIARVAVAPVGLLLQAGGYSLYGQRGDVVTELEVLPGGQRVLSYPIDQCQLPDPCWRRGTR